MSVEHAKGVKALAEVVPPTDVASEEELRSWVEEETGASITGWRQIAGGNRCRSWAVSLTREGAASGIYLRYQPPRPPSAEPYTVWREAAVYRALDDTGVPLPRLIAVHPRHQAIMTELKAGRAEFRSLTDDRERRAIASDFVRGLAQLHKTDFSGRAIPGHAPGMRIADCVRAELDTWGEMYRETGTPDALIDFAMGWLYGNLPDPDGEPVLVHGDAGPGNFLFDRGRMTALIDWELAHAGDPMEDLAWFSMRSVMEPVPDFIGSIREYEQAVGAPVDVARIRYHRVFVSARVVIIRHRNVTGLPGNSIVSRSLNRRLLVDALADATNVSLTAPEPLRAGDTPQTGFFDGIIDSLKVDVAGIANDPRVVAAAKNNAKVVKYLREVDRLGALVEQQELAALSTLLGHPVTKVAHGRAEMIERLGERAIDFSAALQFFAGVVARESQLAALSSGGLATRRLPALEGLGP